MFVVSDLFLNTTISSLTLYGKGSIDNLNETVHKTNERLDKAFNQRAEQFDEQKATASVGEHHKCHQALKTSNYESFKDVNPPRATDTCQWVLQNPTYLKWRDGLSNSLLWVSADPGCGKSVLSKSLIDIDSKKFEPGTLVCHFFFKDNEQQNQLNIALCALLHQIFTREPKLISHAMDLFQRTGDRIQCETSELWRLLLLVASKSQALQIVCVLDALDECRSQDQEILIQNLCHAFENDKSSGTSEGKARLKFFVTSRPYLDIQALFSSLTAKWPQIRLKGEEESDQIKKEIDIVIEIKMKQLALEIGLSPDVHQRFQTQLLQMGNRTYLWLHLVLDDIRTTLNESLQPDAESIKPIPSTVDAAYARVLARVHADQFSTVKKILLIICGARRPLTIHEMAIALGITLQPESSNIRGAQLDPARLSSLIRSLCGLFVIITDSRIHLLHQTAKDFLIRSDSIADIGSLNSLYPLSRTDTESTLAEICVRYLLMDDFRGSEYRFNLWRESDSEIEDRPKHPIPGVYTFLDYSAKHWGRHVRDMSNARYFPLEYLIRQLYDTSSRSFLVWFDSFWQDSDFRRFWSEMVYEAHRIHPLCLAALNGHGHLLEQFLLKRKGGFVPQTTVKGMRDPICENETSAFIWSSWAGHYDICCFLLKKGARLHPVALEAALRQGNTKNMQLLLERGGDSMRRCLEHGNALERASRNNDVGTILFLLRVGFHVDAGKGTEQGTALVTACRRGYTDVVKLLLEKEAEVNLPEYYDEDPLEAACECGSVEIVKLLIEKGAHIDPREEDLCLPRSFPLASACRSGSVEIVRILIQNGANVNATSRYGSCLALAIERGRIDVALLLLQHGARPNVPTDKTEASYWFYKTALTVACSALGNIEVVTLLLDRGADVNAKPRFKQTALAAACSAPDKIEVIKLLLQKGAHADPGAFAAATARGDIEVMGLLREQRPDFNALSEDGGGTALEAAFKADCVDSRVVDYLLKIGVDNQSPNFQKAFDRALIRACAHDNPRYLKMLLDAGASPHFQDRYCTYTPPTALHAAAKHGCIENLRLLLEREADINVLAHSNWGSPLEYACRCENNEALKFLLREATSNGMKISDQVYGLALLHACEQDTTEKVKILLEAGVDIEYQDQERGTALQFASNKPKLNIVKVLLEYGADVNGHSGLNNSSALIEASRMGHLEVVKLLLQEGADIHAVDKHQRSALMLSAAKGHVDIARVLLSHGAHVNYRREFSKPVKDRYGFRRMDFDCTDYPRVFSKRIKEMYGRLGEEFDCREPYETALQAAKACARDPNDDPMVDMLSENGATS